MKIKEMVYDAKSGNSNVVEREQTTAEIESLNKLENASRIRELIANLQSTDYKAIKYAEGLISAEEYAEIKAKRQEWRDEINRLEKEIK